MSKIKEYFQSLVKAGIVPQEPANYDAATLKIYIDYLESENAALRERLEKAVELPFFKKATKLDWNPLTQESTLIEIYLLIYEDFDGYLCYNEIKDKEVAEARLAELKGETK